MTTQSETEIALIGLGEDEVLEVVRIIESGKDTPPKMKAHEDKPDRPDPKPTPPEPKPAPSPLDPQDDPNPGGGDPVGPGKGGSGSGG